MSQDNKSFIITVLMLIAAITTTWYLSIRYHDAIENRAIFQNTELIRFQRDINRQNLWLTEHEIKILKIQTKMYQDAKDFNKVIEWLELSTGRKEEK